MCKRILALCCIACLMLCGSGCYTTIVEYVEIIEDTNEGTSVRLPDVPLISQFPEFPAGCESTCAVMALQYAGEDITVAEFIDEYLQPNDDFYYKNGDLHGPDPFKEFAGDPRDTAYGCMAPVIEQTLIRYFGSDERVSNLSGIDLDELCEQYVATGTPVLTWVTVGMKEIVEGDSWVLPDGETYTWPRGEHCMLLVGYTDSKYVFHDPYTGKVKRYEKSLVQSRYEDLGKQAIAVT